MARGLPEGWRPRDVLPTGDPLPPGALRGRHRLITVSLLLAAAGTALVAVAFDAPLEAGCALLLGALLFVLARRPVSRPVVVLVALTGTALAALNVHVTATVEAHFLFFVLVPLLALYEDRTAFGTTVAAVLGHHLVVGLLWPAAVFPHAAGQAAPLRWTLVHVGLLGLVVLTSLIHWGAHERARDRAGVLLARLEEEARRDPLTGCANRRALDERLASELARARRDDRALAVLALDVDGFKPLNDTYGHAIGDEVLIELAGRIAEELRTSDLVARVGGDEFVLVLPEVGAEEARRVAERIIAAASRIFDAAPERAIGASVGIAVAGEAAGADGAGADAASELLAAADEAMYEAKRRGRGTAVVAGRDPSGPVVGIPVVPVDAKRWSQELREHRRQIARSKELGRLPAGSRAPASVHRTLEALLGAIDRLPDAPVARLPLPDAASVEEFLFHHGAVQVWIDEMIAEGTLTGARSRAARRFWEQLVGGVEVAATRRAVVEAYDAAHAEAARR